MFRLSDISACPRVLKMAVVTFNLNNVFPRGAFQTEQWLADDLCSVLGWESHSLAWSMQHSQVIHDSVRRKPDSTAWRLDLKAYL